jgi:hypothetical protein
MYLPIQGAAKIKKLWRLLKMKNKEKHLKNADVILNLDEITIYDLDSFWSSGCSGKASFYINCHTEHGYCEDPDLIGNIKILDTKRCDEKGVYLLKVKFDKK